MREPFCLTHDHGDHQKKPKRKESRWAEPHLGGKLLGVRKKRKPTQKRKAKSAHTFENWDQYFMTMAFFVGMKSKDASTKVGAVVVGPRKDIRSTGFNGLPRNIVEKTERQERPEKYFWYEHGERNSLYHAAGTTQSLDGCTLYTPWVPCCDCARGIIQSGITEVVVYFDIEGLDRWAEQAKKTLIMFKEAGVKLRRFKGSIVKEIYCQRDGERVF